MGKRKRQTNQNPLSNARQATQSKADHTSFNDDENDDVHIRNTNSLAKEQNGKHEINHPSKKKKKKQTKSPQLSKADAKAQDLWHRKSNAGYSLFISYYGEQPLGICCTASLMDTLISTSSLGSNADHSINGSSGGQSRAAKRRRKKKTKNGAQLSNDVSQERPKESQATAITPKTPSSIDPIVISSSVLLSTFYKNSTFSKKFPDLLPFLLALSRPLPLTFRFRTSLYHEKNFDHDILENESEEESIVSKYKSEFQQILENNPSIRKWIQPVPYDPTQSIYQAILPSQSSAIDKAKVTTLSKVNIQKLCPQLKPLLVKYSTNGCIARQEIGSMLPVLALIGIGAIPSSSTYESIRNTTDVSKSSDHHLRILDMCASPGSKTLQALEQIGPIRGRIVANDVHPLRLQTLKDAIQRSGLSDEKFLSRLKYTNEDASQFPVPKSKRLFDVILVDVPCSGDGTIRKEVKSDKNLILSSWSPNIGNALHELQVRILIRAMELICVGGNVCYSTCSLNPVEDEAVVAAAMTYFHSKNRNKTEDESPKVFALLDFPMKMVPGFTRRNGVHEWKVADYITQNDFISETKNSSDSNETKYETNPSSDQIKNNNDEDNEDTSDENDFGSIRWHKSYKEATENGMVHAYETLWPASKSHDENLSSSLEIPLEKCTRLFPQDQDTGGFFVALIHRVS